MSLVVRFSLTARWVRQARKIERALPAHVETGTAVDELELADDPAGPRHRDVHHLGRTDCRDGPRSTDRRTVDGQRLVCGDTEVRPRSDAHGVHRYRFGARVAQLVH